MMANVTTHKMRKLDRLRVLASEWSAQLRPDTNAVSSKKRTAFRVFMAQRCRTRSKKIAPSIAPCVNLSQQKRDVAGRGGRAR